MYLLFAINICRFHKAEGVHQEKNMKVSKMYVWTWKPQNTVSTAWYKTGLETSFFLASLMVSDSFDFTSQNQFSTSRVKKKQLHWAFTWSNNFKKKNDQQWSILIVWFKLLMLPAVLFTCTCIIHCSGFYWLTHDF